MSSGGNPLATTIISESRTLWIGDVESWMDENYIAGLFANTGSVVSVKVIRDKNTGLPSGYGFVEFSNHEVAQQILSTYNGTPIPGTTKTFRLNWGIFGGGVKTTSLSSNSVPKIMTTTPDYSIYVGDLDPSINDLMLLDFFQQRYKSVISAKVIVDPVTKYSKGYGFIKFNNFEESQRAISEMQGAVFRGRHMKTSQSFWKSANPEGNYMPNMASQSNPLSSAYGGAYGGGYSGTNYSYYDNIYPYLQTMGSGMDPNALALASFLASPQAPGIDPTTILLLQQQQALIAAAAAAQLAPTSVMGYPALGAQADPNALLSQQYGLLNQYNGLNQIPSQQIGVNGGPFSAFNNGGGANGMGSLSYQQQGGIMASSQQNYMVQSNNQQQDKGKFSSGKGKGNEAAEENREEDALLTSEQKLNKDYINNRVEFINFKTDLEHRLLL